MSTLGETQLGLVNWENAPVTRGEYSRDLKALRESITRLQYYVMGSATIATLITSLVAAFAHR